MKVCIAGNRGGHVSYVLSGMEQLTDLKLAGLCAVAEEDTITGLQEWAEKNGHTPEIFDDYKEMFDIVKPDIVAIAGPFQLHAEMCIEAFKRNIHVFCEKPIATTLESLAEVKAAYAKTDVHLATFMGLRYAPDFYTAKQLVDSGKVGKVRLLEARKSYKLGTRAAYYHQRDTYGGTITWVGVHAIDWLYWFSGESFASTSALQSTMYNREHGTLEVSASCQYQMTNEVVASVSIDYLRPANATSFADNMLRVVGTEGTIIVDERGLYLTNAENDGTKPVESGCDKQIFVDFVEQVQGKGKCEISSQDVFAVTEACLLAQKSADTNQALKF